MRAGERKDRVYPVSSDFLLLMRMISTCSITLLSRLGRAIEKTLCMIINIFPLVVLQDSRKQKKATKK